MLILKLLLILLILIVFQLLSECEISGKVPLIDVKQLHSILMNELKSIDSSSTVRASLLQEIQVSNI